MATKRKADCTPEEWERRRELHHEQYKRQMERIRADPERMEKLRERQRRYREKNREKIAATKRRCRQRNPEKYRAHYRKWYELNGRKWYAQNRHVASKVPEPGLGLADMRARVRTEATYAQIWALLPDQMSVEWREDIASEAMVLMLAGDCDDPAEAVKLGRSNLNRATSSYGTISLDAEISEGRRMIDMIADDVPRAGYAA